jgi:hypothetical protein
MVPPEIERSAVRGRYGANGEGGDARGGDARELGRRRRAAAGTRGDGEDGERCGRGSERRKEMR